MTLVRSANLRPTAFFCVLLFWLAAHPAARAQREFDNWYFGQRAGLAFGPGGAVRPLGSGQMVSQAACATLSDANGNLLLYANGEQVWNRQHQIMAGGGALGGTSQTAQGCAVAVAPGSNGQTAYLFGLRYAGPPTPFSTGQPWVAEVDLAGAGGLGQVTRQLLPVVADSVLQRLGEREFAPYQALVRHANGRDFWLLTRLHQQGVFLSTLVTGNGAWPSPVTVSSRVLPTRVSSAATWCGSLVASPDGRTLLYNDVATSWLLRFDPATGRASNAVQLAFPAPSVSPTPSFNPYCYGAAFSPDGSKCYLSREYQAQQAGSTGSGTQVVQYDLAAGFGPAVAASGVEVAGRFSTRGQLPWGMQRGSDGRIYLAVTDADALDVILTPNARGAACRYTSGAQPLNGRLATRNLPLQPNNVGSAAPPAVQLADAYGCAGQPVRLQASGAGLGTAGDTLVWSLGNGQLPVRTVQLDLTTVYPAAGTYALRLSLRRGGQVLQTATATAYVFAAPQVQLGPPDTLRCGPFEPLRLQANPQPAGSSYRWQDGSTGTTLLATRPGRYWLEVANASGCAARDSITVGVRDCAVFIPNIITPNGDEANENFVLQNLNAAEWSLTVFNRWGGEVFRQAAYDNRWNAAGQAAGLYYYLLENSATKQRYRGWVEVVR